MTDAAGGQNVETVAERREHLRKRFTEQLRRIQLNYHICVRITEQALTFNESLASLKRLQRPKAHRQPFRARMHPFVELAVNHHAQLFAQARSPDAPVITQADVERAAFKTLRLLEPRRGRPENEFLRIHVHALMVLYRETTGSDIATVVTQGGEYMPGIKAPCDRFLPRLFSDVDPTVTTTAIVNIIMQAKASGTVKDKRFVDFFPFEANLDASTGQPVAAPGVHLERFELSVPIYSS